MRGLTVIGGIIALTQAGPIARAAWQASQADTVVYYMRTGQAAKVDAASARAGIDALGRAIAADPVPTRYLNRSELVGAAALTPSLGDAAVRKEWMRRARADLVTGLAGAPAHGIDWLRLATLQLELEGPSRSVMAMLFISIEMAGRMPQTWRPRLRLILDSWPLLNDQQKERLKAHVAMIWDHSRLDRRLFGYVTHSAADQAILTWFLRDVPKAPYEYADIIQKVQKE
ncbi:hypothetical protein BH10PSE6_BH10PSE6_19170 [soil metagenome]